MEKDVKGTVFERAVEHLFYYSSGEYVNNVVTYRDCMFKTPITLISDVGNIFPIQVGDAYTNIIFNLTHGEVLLFDQVGVSTFKFDLSFHMHVKR